MLSDATLYDLRVKTLSTEYFHIYFTTNSNRSEIRIGVTRDLSIVNEQVSSVQPLFNGYAEVPTRLVYVETHSNSHTAKARFEQLLRWTRAQKERLIRKKNPDWVVLYATKIQNEKLFYN